MMTQLITPTPDPVASAPPDKSPATDTPDDSGDGFAMLLASMCATPAPMTTPVELIEAAVSDDSITAVEAALPNDNLLAATLPSEGLLNLTAMGLTEQNALPEAAINLDPSTLTAQTLPDAATKVELLPDNTSVNVVSDNTARSESLLSTTLLRGESKASTNALSYDISISEEESKGAPPLQAEAARRDLFSLASTLAETTRQTKPPLIPTSLSSFLSEGQSEAQPDAKGNASASTQIASSTPTASTFSVEMAAVPNNIAAGPSAASTITGQIINPILTTSETLARHETRTLKLSLQPEALGQVEVEITRHAQGGLSARISAEQEFARHALADGLGELRAAMEKAGLPVERLEVNIGPGLHFGHHGQTENQQSNPSGSSSGPRMTATEFAEAESTITSSASAAQDRLLSLRA